MQVRRLKSVGVALATVVVLLSFGLAQQRSEGEAGEMEPVADKLLAVVRDGLIDHDAEKMLSAFDGNDMVNYVQFAGDVRAFFATYGDFRALYQVTQTSSTKCGDARCAFVSAEFQLQGTPTYNPGPDINRSRQLQLTLRETNSGWKIVDLRPREFFR